MRREIQVRHEDGPEHCTVWRGQVQLTPITAPEGEAVQVAKRLRNPDETVVVVEEDGYRRSVTRKSRDRHPNQLVPLSRARRANRE